MGRLVNCEKDVVDKVTRVLLRRGFIRMARKVVRAVPCFMHQRRAVIDRCTTVPIA